MEELIKFLTSPQSVRNFTFMFLWRILLCILMTNEIMNSYGYFFTKKELTTNLVVFFFFTPEFLLATCVYLVCVFAFFWFFKIIGFVAIIAFSRKPIDIEELIALLQNAKIITKSNNNEFGFLITDSDSDAFIKAVIKDKKDIGKSKTLDFVSNWLNVAFSTTVSYFQVYHKIPHLFGFYFGVFMLILTFIMAIIATIVVYYYAKLDLLESLRNDLSKYGYFKTDPL